MLREAERYRESFIKTRVDTSVVRKARRIVMNFDNRTRTLERRAHEAIHREAKLVRELILFGSDVQAALTAVKRFRAQR